MQLFSADTTILKSVFVFNFFDHKMLNKPPSKVAQKRLKSTYFPYCPNGPNRRIHVPNCGL